MVADLRDHPGADQRRRREAISWDRALVCLIIPLMGGLLIAAGGPLAVAAHSASGRLALCRTPQTRCTERTTTAWPPSPSKHGRHCSFSAASRLTCEAARPRAWRI